MVVSLTLISVLCLALTASCIGLLRRLSRMSMSPSPTPSTTPTPISDEALTKILMTMTSTFETSAKETRELVTALVLGREPQPTSGPMETAQISSVTLPNYDDDSIPLPAGIEAVMRREVVESEQERLLTERAALMQQLADRQTELDQLNGSGGRSSNEPWTAQASGSSHSSP